MSPWSTLIRITLTLRQILLNNQVAAIGLRERKVHLERSRVVHWNMTVSLWCQLNKTILKGHLFQQTLIMSILPSILEEVEVNHLESLVIILRPIGRRNKQATLIKLIQDMDCPRFLKTLVDLNSMKLLILREKTINLIKTMLCLDLQQGKIISPV